MHNRPRVVLFVTNYNSSGFLPLVYRSIESALNIDYDDLDVVLIDNNSTDGSYEAILDRFREDLIFIRLRRNYGYSGGNELGFRRYVVERCLPDYVIFMDNDFYVTNQDAVREIIGFMEKNGKVALASGYMLKRDGKRIQEAGGFLDVFGDLVHRFEDLRPGEAPEVLSYVSYLSGAFMVSKVRPILKIRGKFYQPRMFVYWDDIELAVSLWTHGLYSVSLPIEVGIHHGSSTLSKRSPLATYFSIRNWFALLESYWRDHLRAFAMLTKLFYIQRLPKMILAGERGTASMRGFIDSRHRIFSYHGNFYPFVIMPKRIKVITARRLLIPFLRFKILGYDYRSYYSKVSSLSITEEVLKSSLQPYIVPVDI